MVLAVLALIVSVISLLVAILPEGAVRLQGNGFTGARVHADSESNWTMIYWVGAPASSRGPVVGRGNGEVPIDCPPGQLMGVSVSVHEDGGGEVTVETWVRGELRESIISTPAVDYARAGASC